MFLGDCILDFGVYFAHFGSSFSKNGGSRTVNHEWWILCSRCVGDLEFGKVSCIWASVYGSTSFGGVILLTPVDCAPFTTTNLGRLSTHNNPCLPLLSLAWSCPIDGQGQQIRAFLTARKRLAKSLMKLGSAPHRLPITRHCESTYAV